MAKNENFTMVPMGNFCYVTLILRDSSMEIGKLLGIYVTQVVNLYVENGDVQIHSFCICCWCVWYRKSLK